MNTYTFEGVRFMPGYNDFDWDQVEIRAESEKEAWELLNKRYKHWKRVGIVNISPFIDVNNQINE